MPERLIPISKKQHDAIAAASAAVKTAQHNQSLIVSTILLACDDDFGANVNYETRVKDGVYTLAVLLPDIAPSAQADVA